MKTINKKRIHQKLIKKFQNLFFRSQVFTQTVCCIQSISYSTNEKSALSVNNTGISNQKNMLIYFYVFKVVNSDDFLHIHLI